MSNFGKNLALWVIIALLMVLLFNLFQSSTQRGVQRQWAYSKFLTELDAGQIRTSPSRAATSPATSTTAPLSTPTHPMIRCWYSA